MRIFNIKKVVTCALLDNSRPDLSKQSDKQPHYALNIYPYCENDSDLIPIDLLKNTLKNLNVLCLQKPPEQNQFNLAHTIKRKPFGGITKAALDQTKKKVKAGVIKIIKPLIGNSKKRIHFKKNKKYLRQYQFNTSNSDSSFPIFLFYQHEASELSTQVAQLLNNYWHKLDANLIKNLSLSKAVHQNQGQSKISITEMDKDPHLKILNVVIDIFNEIEKQLFVSILGIFLDPYFISKKDNKLIAEHVVDKRSSRIIELAIHDAGNQQESCSSKQDTELLLSKIEINENNIDADSQSLCSEESIIFSTDSDSMKSNSNVPEIVSFQEEEINKNLVKDAQFFSNANITNEPVLESSQKNVQSTSVSVQPTYNCLIPKEQSSSNWNPKVKEKINYLLLSYKKHLSKKYFFRASGYITENKKIIISDLLNKLNSYSPENFYIDISRFSKSNILNQHRDTSFIQKIGQFFKRHNKTEGTFLLENIVSTLNENNTMITMSV